MDRAKNFIRRFIADESGVTSIEYGVLAVLLVTAIGAAMTTYGTNLGTAFTNIGAKLSAAIP